MADLTNPFAGLGGDESNPFAGLGTTPLDEAEDGGWFARAWSSARNIVKGTIAATPTILAAPFEGLGAINEFMQGSVKQVAGVSPREAYSAVVKAGPSA